MLKKDKIILLSILIFSVIAPSVHAGIHEFQGYIHLTPFSKEVFCGISLYSTDPQNGTYILEYSENIKPFVKSIKPNDIQITSIFYRGSPPNVPGGFNAIYDFLNKICSENSTDACVNTCTEFHGLGLKKISFNISGPKEQMIVGQVYDTVIIGESRGKEVLQFVVFYTPFDGRIIIGGVVGLILFIILAILFVRRFLKKKALTKIENRTEKKIEK
jgi:hypothetical protein